MPTDHRNHYTTPVQNIAFEDCVTLIKMALLEDAPDGDPTSESIFSSNSQTSARIVSRENGIVCGLVLLPYILKIYKKLTSAELLFESNLNDSSRFKAGDCLGILAGKSVDILRLERIILNFLQYLSGISTTVDSVVKLAGPDISILDTRKTIPGYRKLAKYAVYCGGGTNHRLNLCDMAMIKDNHIRTANSITKAIELVRKKNPKLPLNVEVDTIDQLKEILPLDVDVILLDNMRNSTLSDAIDLIRNCDNQPLIEVSGGWKPEELHQLKGLGKIGVSMGFLTHTTRFLDFSLDF